ncbi:MAG: hypothetical protein L0H73_15370 [Nitrococcus sp.]|nr:hypothetical protein [Nitrococcus sp.]
MAWQSLKVVVLVEPCGASIHRIDDYGGGSNLFTDENCPAHGVDKKITGVAAASIALINRQLSEEYYRQRMMFSTGATEIFGPIIRMDAGA